MALGSRRKWHTVFFKIDVSSRESGGAGLKVQGERPKAQGRKARRDRHRAHGSKRKWHTVFLKIDVSSRESGGKRRKAWQLAWRWA